MGIYKLSEPKENSEDWILMIDESIEFGHEKLLVILGIKESSIDFSRALHFHDMKCMTLKASDSWKGEDIKKVLEGLTGELGTIKYVVADMGNAIKNALGLLSIPHVVDVNHKFSWFVKQLYKDDIVFKSYMEKLARLRGSLSLSNMSHILPPQQRANSRYMNLLPIFKWGMAILKMIGSDTADPEEKKMMMFVKDYESLIIQTYQLIEIANGIQEILKNNGLSKESIQESLDTFEGVTEGKTLELKEMIAKYLSYTLMQTENSEKILCSSDILESSFGRYKNYISDNVSVGITDLSLSIPAFGSKLGKDEVLQAMEKIKVSKINDWKTENIGDTQTKKRRASLKMERRKKKKCCDF